MKERKWTIPWRLIRSDMMNSLKRWTQSSKTSSTPRTNIRRASTREEKIEWLISKTFWTKRETIVFRVLMISWIQFTPKWPRTSLTSKLRRTPEISKKSSMVSLRSILTPLLFKEQVEGVFIPLWLIILRITSSRRSLPRVQEFYCSRARGQALRGRKGCCKRRSYLGTEREGSPAIWCC